MAPKGTVLSIERAWNAVPLEERIELISRSNAQGISAGAGFVALVGSIAYGFDAIWLLWSGFIGALIVAPLFASKSWRKGKPALILKNLAARSVARRYGYGCNIPDLDLVIIFEGVMREIFSSEEEESLRRQAENTDFDEPIVGDKVVWIALMKGGVVVMAERSGGAKLAFSAIVGPDLQVRRAHEAEGLGERSVVVTGTGLSRGKTIALWSKNVGALYVFEKRLEELVFEDAQARQRILEAAANRGKH